MSRADRPAIGLRERKKAKTRAAIQEHALRLFQDQGYSATTVDQIAEAAEVSQSTFFRYFPTKEDVVIWDEFDPLLIEAFKSQPPDVSPIHALRGAFLAVIGDLPPDELERQRERVDLVLSVPELRARMLDQFIGGVQQLAEVVAERVGRRADELAVRAFAGATGGAMLAALLSAADDPTRDFVGLIDAAMKQLEDGLPL